MHKTFTHNHGKYRRWKFEQFTVKEAYTSICSPKCIAYMNTSQISKSKSIFTVSSMGLNSVYNMVIRSSKYGSNTYKISLFKSITKTQDLDSIFMESNHILIQGLQQFHMSFLMGVEVLHHRPAIAGTPKDLRLLKIRPPLTKSIIHRKLTSLQRNALRKPVLRYKLTVVDNFKKNK